MYSLISYKDISIHFIVNGISLHSNYQIKLSAVHIMAWITDITRHLDTQQNGLLFRWWSKYQTILFTIQMQFEYWTIIGHLNSGKVKVSYSDVCYSDPHCTWEIVESVALTLISCHSQTYLSTSSLIQPSKPIRATI